MRVAIVHDWLNQNGGAENVLTVLHGMFPEAPVYTSIFRPEVFPHYRGWDIRTSFLDRIPGARYRHQSLLPLYPLAFESFDFSGYDVVISNSSGFCHLVKTPPEVCHVNYCLTPPRFLYSPTAYLEREQVAWPLRAAVGALLGPLRAWDARARDRVDTFVGISRAVQERIAQRYGRDSLLVYPPVECDAFPPAYQRGDYYLIVSRLVPYKRVDLAVAAFTRLGMPLVVAGDGRDRAALEALAGPTITFLGRVPQADLPGLMAGCRAFVFPGEEDFGIAPLEAMAAGRPVIAYAAGGALETVIEGETGCFFHRQTVDDLAGAVQRLERMTFDHHAIRRHAEKFDTAVFRHELLAAISTALTAKRNGAAAAPRSVR